MGEKSSFPYRKYDRKPHPYIVKQILEDHQMTEMMREVLIQEGKPCPFCHRKLGEKKEKNGFRNSFFPHGNHTPQQGLTKEMIDDKKQIQIRIHLISPSAKRFRAIKMVNLQLLFTNFIFLYWGFDLSPPCSVFLNDSSK